MRLPIALSLSLSLLAGCGGISVDVGQDLPEQKVPGNSTPLAQLCPQSLCSLFQVPLMVDLQSVQKQQNTGPAQAAHLKSLSLTATPPGSPSGNWDFLDAVHISTSGGSLPEVEIAKLDPVPRGQTTLNFNVVGGVDLLPYVKAGATIDSKATGRQPTKDFTFDGHLVITVSF